MASTVKPAELKIFVFQQKIPRDGHGPVVLIAKDLPDASGQLFDRFREKYPKVTSKVAESFILNYSHISYPVKVGIILDHHGI